MTIGKYPYDVGDSIFDRHYGIKDETYDGKKIQVTDVVEFECDGSHDVLMKLLTTVGVDRGDNAAVLAIQMLAMSDTDLSSRFAEWRKSRTARVIADDESLRE